MVFSSLQFLLHGGLPQHCYPTSPILQDVSTYFGVCIPTPLAAISTLLGTLSIVSWLFAQMPQVFKNYQIKSTAGLSIFFLVEWLLGDVTNLLGCLFTRQAGWQITIASYYTFVDICLVVQYFWYTHCTHWIYAESLHSLGDSEAGDEDDDDANGDLINDLSPINSNFGDDDPLHQDENDNSGKDSASTSINVPQFNRVNYGEKKQSAGTSVSYNDKFGLSWIPSPSPRTFIYAATLSHLASNVAAAPVSISSDPSQGGSYLFSMETPLETAGTILSWSSTILYLGSRLPQLYKNWCRQSTAGLSPLLFFAAFCGNLFYSTSLLTNPNAWSDYGPHGHHGWVDGNGSQRWVWVARACPFFLGSAGCLSMDALMGVQFMIYGEHEDRIVKVRDGHGYSHWEKVNGWMRGWIPSIAGKDRVVDMAESQRLLTESQRLSMTRRRSNMDYGTLE